MDKKIKIIMILTLILIMNNCVYGNTYITENQANEMIDAYNTQFGTNINHVTFGNQSKYVGQLIAKNDSNNYIVRFIKPATNSSYQIELQYSNKKYSIITKQTNGGNQNYIYINNATSGTNSINVTDNIMISTELPFISSTSLIVYSYNYNTGSILGTYANQITEINNQVNNINTSITVLQDQVNQQGQKIEEIQNENGDIEGAINNLTLEVTKPYNVNSNDLVGQDINSLANNFTMPEIPYKYANTITSITSGFANALTGRGNIPLNINIKGKNYTINSNDIAMPNGILKTFISVLVNGFMILPLILYVKKITNDINAGNIEGALNKIEDDESNLL